MLEIPSVCSSCQVQRVQHSLCYLHRYRVICPPIDEQEQASNMSTDQAVVERYVHDSHWTRKSQRGGVCWSCHSVRVQVQSTTVHHGTLPRAVGAGDMGTVVMPAPVLGTGSLFSVPPRTAPPPPREDSVGREAACSKKGIFRGKVVSSPDCQLNLRVSCRYSFTYRALYGWAVHGCDLCLPCMCTNGKIG